VLTHSRNGYTPTWRRPTPATSYGNESRGHATTCDQQQLLAPVCCERENGTVDFGRSAVVYDLPSRPSVHTRDEYRDGDEGS